MLSLSISLTVSLSFSSVRPTMRTWAPSLTKSLAVAAPIPLPPPVITATLPASLPTVFSLLVVVCRRRAGPRRAWTHHAQSVSTRRCPARHNFTDGRDGFSEARPAVPYEGSASESISRSTDPVDVRGAHEDDDAMDAPLGQPLAFR